MKKNKKNILIVILIFISTVSTFYFFHILKIDQARPLIKEVVPKALSTKERMVSFAVFDMVYKISIEEGDTVFKAMINLRNQKENNFTFAYKEYSSLGVFINEINRVVGNKGKYWIYYVNGKEAGVGISNYILEEGDIISWKLE